MMKKAMQLALVITGLLVMGMPCVAKAEKTGKIKIAVTPFGKEQAGEVVYPRSLVVSLDKNHLAYVTRNEKLQKSYVVVDGKPQKKWDAVVEGSFQFTPVKNRHAYIVINGKKKRLVVDGKVSPAYDHVYNYQFSPDEKYFAFQVKNAGKRYIYVNAKRSPGYDLIGEYKFGPQSKRFAYTACEGDTCSAYLDGRKKPDFRGVMSPVFSPDARNFAYIAGWQGDMKIMLNDRPLPVSGLFIGMTMFSLDSKRFAYGVQTKEGWQVVVDNAPGPIVAKPGRFLFSPDSSRYAYTGKIEEKTFIFVDSKRFGPYDAIRQLSFSKDSKYVWAIAIEGGNAYLLRNGEVIDSREAIFDPLIFSQNEKHLAYKVQTDDNEFAVVRDGKKGKAYNGVARIRLTANNTLYYMAEKGKQYCTVVEGKESAMYDMIESPVMSEDDKHFVFAAKKGKKWVIVGDGVESEKSFDDLVFGARILFSAPNKCHLLVIVMEDNKPVFQRWDITL